MDDEYLSTNLQHCAQILELAWVHVGRRSCLSAPVQVAHTGTDLQPTHEVLG